VFLIEIFAGALPGTTSTNQDASIEHYLRSCQQI